MAQTNWQNLIANHTHPMTDVAGLSPCVMNTEAGIAELETKVAKMAADIGSLTPQWPVVDASAIATEIRGLSRVVGAIDRYIQRVGAHALWIQTWVAFGALSIWVIAVEIGMIWLS